MDALPETKVRPYVRPEFLRTLRVIPFLGSLPNDIRDLAYLDQCPEGAEFMPMKWWQIIATAASAMGVAALLYGFVPGMQTSLLSLVLMPLPFEPSTKDVIATVLMLAYLTLIIGVIMSGKKTSSQDGGSGSTLIPNGLFVAAIREEMAFRSGCEAWTLRQRITAPVAFGLVHFLNIIFPLSAIVAITCSGAVFQWVYLRAYSQTGNYLSATFSSADFHYRYNLSVIGLAALGSSGLILYTLFTT